jgi:CO dehydrogenase/acetyl-CoA synthase beta subunit
MLLTWDQAVNETLRWACLLIDAKDEIDRFQRHVHVGNTIAEKEWARDTIEHNQEAPECRQMNLLIHSRNIAINIVFKNAELIILKIIIIDE